MYAYFDRVHTVKVLTLGKIALNQFCNSLSYCICHISNHACATSTVCAQILAGV